MNLTKARKLLKKDVDYTRPKGERLLAGLKILYKYDPEMDFSTEDRLIHISNFEATVA